MLTLLTDSEKYSKLFERIGFRLGYVHITAPTHNEKTGMRTARMGTLEDAKSIRTRGVSLVTQKDNVGGTSGGYAVVLHEEVNNPSDEQFADKFHKNLDGKSLHGQVPQTAKTEVMEEALVRGVLTKVKVKPSGCDNCKNTTRYIVQACSTATNKPLQWTGPFRCKGKAISYMKVCNEQLPVISNRYYRVSPVL